MTQRILYRGHVYTADTDMINFQKSIDPFFDDDHIPPGQIGEVRVACLRCHKIMSTYTVPINLANEHQFKFNFAALKGAPKYVSTLFGDCGCRAS